MTPQTVKNSTPHTSRNWKTPPPLTACVGRHEQYGDKLVLSTSFGIQSAVMLHLVTTQIPDIPVIFIDTGYLFPETYRFAEALTERLTLNLKTYLPRQSAAQQEAVHGKLWEQGVEGLGPIQSRQQGRANEPRGSRTRRDCMALGSTQAPILFAREAHRRRAAKQDREGVSDR